MSPAGAQPPSAPRAALQQCLNEGRAQGCPPQPRPGLRRLSGPRAAIHGRGSPPALLSIPTLALIPIPIPALIPIPIPIPVLPGSSTGPTAGCWGCDLLPRATCSAAELCSSRWSQDLADTTLGTQLRNQVSVFGDLRPAQVSHPRSPEASLLQGPPGRLSPAPTKGLGRLGFPKCWCQLSVSRCLAWRSPGIAQGTGKTSQQPVLPGGCVPQPSRDVSGGTRRMLLAGVHPPTPPPAECR